MSKYIRTMALIGGLTIGGILGAQAVTTTLQDNKFDCIRDEERLACHTLMSGSHSGEWYAQMMAKLDRLHTMNRLPMQEETASIKTMGDYRHREKSSLGEAQGAEVCHNGEGSRDSKESAFLEQRELDIRPGQSEFCYRSYDGRYKDTKGISGMANKK